MRITRLEIDRVQSADAVCGRRERDRLVSPALEGKARRASSFKAPRFSDHALLVMEYAL